MAIQKDLKFRGTINNLIFYERMGGFYVRTKPARVNQTPATKARAQDFAQACRLCKTLRTMLAPVNPCGKDKGVMRRLNKALLQYLLGSQQQNDNLDNSLQFITGFQFNDQTDIRERLKTKISVNTPDPDMLQLRLPALMPGRDISAPAHTKFVEWKIMAAACSVKDAVAVCDYATGLMMPYDDTMIPPQAIPLPLPAADDNLKVVAIALQYHAMKKGMAELANDLRWLPSGIVWAGR